MSALKSLAPLNISFMSVQLETSHLDKSLVNEEHPPNIPFISVTLETSQLVTFPLNWLRRASERSEYRALASGVWSVECRGSEC